MVRLVVTSQRTGGVSLNFKGLTDEFMEFKDDLKRGVYFRDRRWDSDSRLWFLSSLGQQSLVLLLQSWAGRIVVEWDGKPYSLSKEPRRSVAECYKVLQIDPAACQAVVRAAYLALARIYHPDRGGDLREMQRLNDAYHKALEGLSNVFVLRT